MGLAEALALIAITVPTLVQWLSGQPVTGGDWAAVTGAVANALINHTSGNNPMPDYGPALQRIELALEKEASNKYQDCMTAGRRFLSDLPVQQPYYPYPGRQLYGAQPGYGVQPYYPAQQPYQADPNSLIRDARSKFVDASAVAERMGDAYRMAEAEVAIAGCWLMLQSLPDMQRALSQARTILEEALLNGAGPQMVRAYIHVLQLCRASGEVHRDVGIPLDPAAKTTDGMFAVEACWGQWVGCLDVWVRLHGAELDPAGRCNFVTLEVSNLSWPKIRFCLGAPRTQRTLPSARRASVPVQENIWKRIERWSDDPVEAIMRWGRGEPPPATTYLTTQRPAANPPGDWRYLNRGSLSGAITLPSLTIDREVAVKVQLIERGLRGHPGITFLVPGL
ncbi:MAG: hypothetical protein ACRDTF_22060 [Pseudonocardiaceae bacterium]